MLREDRDQFASKLEDTKAMMTALSDSKVMANRMIAEHKDKEEKMAKELENLQTMSDNNDKMENMELRLQELNDLIRTMDGQHSEKFQSLRQEIETLRQSVENSSRSSLVGSETSEMLRSDFIGQKLQECQQKDQEAAKKDETDPQTPQPELTISDALPIPILPVQTVEAMAAAAKGGVEQIKQLFNTLQATENDVSFLGQ